MNRQEYVHIQSERSSLRRILEDIPEEDVLDRGSVQSRLEEVEHEIAEAKVDERQPARARLTFQGRPVVASHGIFAEFATTVTKSFTEVVARVAAALAGPLAAMGPIPSREQNQLLITSTAIGSFGFELEEHRTGQLPLDESPVAEALDVTQRLLQSMLGTDDELADAVAGTDPRAVASLRSFLAELTDNEAVCALEYRGHTFRFGDVGEVRRSLERIGQDNLHEEEKQLDGEFQGILPKRRMFEFKLAANDEVIRGKVGPAITDADTLNQHLHQHTRIKVLATQVGTGRPRYVLTELPCWPGGT